MLRLNLKPSLWLSLLGGSDPTAVEFKITHRITRGLSVPLPEPNLKFRFMSEALRLLGDSYGNRTIFNSFLIDAPFRQS